MGVDKAGLVLDGEPLWLRQLGKLRATGAAEVFVSGRADGPYAAAGVEVVEDATPAAGPLAGIEAALRHARHEWLLVLAVDLPEVPAEFLAQLVENAIAAKSGLVPSRADWLQPLAAVYPRACLALATQCLAGENRSMRRFFRLARKEKLVDMSMVSDEEQVLFKNLNTPADLAPVVPGA